jgi:prepilin signal peptidase PulO-like enzyme (type II secretory pathway)
MIPALFNHKWEGKNKSFYGYVFSVINVIIFLLMLFGIIMFIKEHNLSILLILFILTIMFIIPPFLIGVDGIRYRLPIEVFIVIVGFYGFKNILYDNRQITKRI